MNLLVSGSSGLVGTQLLELAAREGHPVTRLVRKSQPPAIQWDPASGKIDAAACEGFDAIVHLGGENIAEGRWTAAKKKRIRDSRVESTKLLAQTIANLERKPAVFVCASAIGFYGDRDAEVMNESSAAGTGYLSDVCQEWEASTAPAAASGVRVVNLRIGVVLSKSGGALAKVLLPFKMGAGGIVGSGKQYWSCVALSDLVAMILFCCENDSLSGPVNAVGAESTTNLVFTKTLGRILKRPTIFPLPAFAARLALGQMADELLLASTRVEPSRLVSAGYEFRCSDLESSLRSALA